MGELLIDKIGKEPTRAAVVRECCELIETHVKNKGLVIKAGYATVKTVKKSFVPEVVDALLDEWLTQIQPHFDRWSAAPTASFADYLITRQDDVAEDLLKVTDRRAEKSSHGSVRKLYSKLRDSAKSNVVQAVPDLARLVARHLG